MSTAAAKSTPARPPREITGRTVLICILAFFGIVTAANAVMIRFAISTFGGVETESSYKAGLSFARERAAAEAQDKRRWSVAARLVPTSDGLTRIDLTATDADGRLLTGHSAKVLLAHPTDRRLDRELEMILIAPGRYTARTEIGDGQWDMMIDLTQDGERRFRSRQRIVLPREAQP